MNESKRFKHDYTSLEQLPNELFLEFFGYLNGIDIIYGFSQLNYRFYYLLKNYIKTFNFKSISKVKFDYVTQHHDIHEWQSLCLSDDDETPGQIQLFCQLFPPSQYISQLKSLSAINMRPKYAQEFLSQLTSFKNLVSLTIGKICGENIQPFELPSLQQLVVTACGHNTWMMNFHSLQNLEYTITYTCPHKHVLTLPTTLKQLKLYYDEANDGNTVEILLSQLFQLTKLALYDNGTYRSMPNGQKWEKLIQSSLPLLTTFQFCFPFHCYRSTFNDINQAIASFSTPFYLCEKRWFIRCDSDSRYAAMGVLYTLPFAFSEMPINITSFDTSVSTLITSDIDEIKYDTYNKIKTIMFNEKCEIPYRAFLTSKIVRLVLKTALPTNWHFLLTNLRYLEFRRTLHMTSIDFTQLLANTPQLQSLTLPIMILIKLTDKFTNNTICDQLSHRIQSLTICNYYSDGFDLGIVSVRLLSSLVRIFGKSCKHLSLALAAHPNTVLPTLKRMRQLRSLHIRCHPWCRTSHTTAKSWLEQSLTETDVTDFAHSPDDYDYYVWFGDRL